MSTQPEAIRLAAWMREGAWHQMTLGDVEAAGRELRRLHTENEQLKAQRKPMTDEQREEIAKGWRSRNWTVGDIINAIEAAHGIKGDA